MPIPVQLFFQHMRPFKDHNSLCSRGCVISVDLAFPLAHVIFLDEELPETAYEDIFPGGEPFFYDFKGGFEQGGCPVYGITGLGADAFRDIGFFQGHDRLTSFA